MPINTGNKKSKLYLGSSKVSKAYLGSIKIYSSGNVVTYYVDEDAVYREDVEEGESCLEPKTFTIPPKNGYLFAGWSLESGGEVLSALAMEDEPVELYAVFQDANVVNNPNYVTYSPRDPGQLEYNGTTVPGWAIIAEANCPAYNVGPNTTYSGSITVKLNGHKKVKLVLIPGGSNTTIFWATPIINRSIVTINGVTVYNSSTMTAPGELTYEYTTDVTLNFSINATVLTGNLQNPYEDSTWCYSELFIKSITLSDE